MAKIFFWFKAYPGHYYVFSEPRGPHDQPATRKSVGEVKRITTQVYASRFEWEHLNLSFEGRASPISRIKHLEQCVQNFMPGTTFERENW